LIYSAHPKIQVKLTVTVNTRPYRDRARYDDILEIMNESYRADDPVVRMALSKLTFERATNRYGNLHNSLNTHLTKKAQ